MKKLYRFYTLCLLLLLCVSLFCVQTERLYKKEHPIVWRCLNCGFVMLSKEAFRVCPVCGKDRGWAEGDIQTRRLGKES